MKKLKVVVFLLCVGLLVGCNNTKLSEKTPKEIVEQYLKNYQTLDDKVLSQLDEVVEREEFTDQQKNDYIELMKRHYQNLKYEIKDDMVDGDKAIVTTSVEVYDYSKELTDADEYLEKNPDKFNNADGEYDVALFNSYRLDRLKKVEYTVKYTIDFYLSKTSDGWVLDELSDTDESKIHGTYIY